MTIALNLYFCLLTFRPVVFSTTTTCWNVKCRAQYQPIFFKHKAIDRLITILFLSDGWPPSFGYSFSPSTHALFSCLQSTRYFRLYCRPISYSITIRTYVFGNNNYCFCMRLQYVYWKNIIWQRPCIWHLTHKHFTSGGHIVLYTSGTYNTWIIKINRWWKKKINKIPSEALIVLFKYLTNFDWFGTGNATRPNLTNNTFLLHPIIFNVIAIAVYLSRAILDCGHLDVE